MVVKANYFLLLLLFLPVVVVAQDNATSTRPDQSIDLQALVKRCESCHGHHGKSVRNDIPDLAGKPSSEIEAEIAEFNYYERHCPAKIPDGGDLLEFPISMCDIANTLSKEEIQSLAQYFVMQSDATAD